MQQATPSPGNSIAIQLRYRNEIGKLSAVTAAIASAGGSIGNVEVVRSDRTHIVREITVNTVDEQHAKRIVDVVKAVPDVEVITAYDCTFKLHEGGKLDVVSKSKMKDYVDLSMAYTPGVARVCMAIHNDPAMAREYTIRRNTVAIISDGTAVLGLGNIGALAAMPVMEGKAVLFKEFGGVNAFPLCVDTKDPGSARNRKGTSVTFGGINLEDIAPRASDRTAADRGQIPVFSDQLERRSWSGGVHQCAQGHRQGPANIKGVVVGAGASGAACTRALMDL